MGKELIIAEKPSLARNICAALGQMTDVIIDGKKVGYENSKYIVTYAFGHLLSLCDAKDYNPDLEKWNIETLPIIPPGFQYKVKSDTDGGIQKQLNAITRLMQRNDIDNIINAGDSDREGEIIVRNILLYAGNKKPVFRLWMPDQTSDTINAELQKHRPDSEYDKLAYEGYARTFVDWLYGINLTRLATIKANTLLRVGRVTTPIITAICERERNIRNFVKEKYYVAQHEANGIRLTSETRFSAPNDCEKLCNRYNSGPLTVQSVKNEKKTLPRPKLFALSDLQGICGKLHNMSPIDTLNTLQSLYESRYVTYPRTDSQYMTTAEEKRAENVITALKNASSHGLPDLSGISFRYSKEIFDDEQVDTHSAITPTTLIPDLSRLTVEQKNVYLVIVRRFASAFCSEEYMVNRTNAVIQNSFETFKLKGDVILTKGYTIYERPDKKETPLPVLIAGQQIPADFQVIEKETEPPQHYTTETLNRYLKNPYSKDEKKALSEEDEQNKDVISDIELGTEATRAGLIERAIRDKYITLNKNRYGITDQGEFYVDTLARLDIDMTKERTLNLSKALKLVYRGQMDYMAAVRSAEDDLKFICETTKAISIAPGNVSGIQGAMCVCPRCGQAIFEKPKTYSCSNKDCGIILYREDNFLARYKKTITPSVAKSFFTKGYADFHGLVSVRDTSKTFDARIIVNFPEGKKYPEYKFDFEDKKSPPLSKQTFAKCPKCGKDIVEFVKDNRTVYGCSGQCGVFLYRDSNKFMTTFGKDLTDDIARRLFAGEQVFVEGFINPKDGKCFSHTIRLDCSEKYSKIVWGDSGT